MVRKRGGREGGRKGGTVADEVLLTRAPFLSLSRFDGSGYIHSLRLDAETQTANYSGQFVQTPILKVGKGRREGGKEGKEVEQT